MSSPSSSPSSLSTAFKSFCANSTESNGEQKEESSNKDDNSSTLSKISKTETPETSEHGSSQSDKQLTQTSQENTCTARNNDCDQSEPCARKLSAVDATTEPADKKEVLIVTQESHNTQQTSKEPKALPPMMPEFSESYCVDTDPSFTQFAPDRIQRQSGRSNMTMCADSFLQQLVFVNMKPSVREYGLRVGTKPKKLLQKLLDGTLDFDSQPALWFHLLENLNYEYAWMIVRCAFQFHPIGTFDLGALGTIIPILSDTCFFYPNFVLAERPSVNVVQQLVTGNKNPIQPMGSLLSLAAEVTKDTYEYLRGDLIAEKPFVSNGEYKLLEGDYNSLRKRIVTHIGPIRLFPGRVFKPGDIKLSLSHISQLLIPMGKETPAPVPSKLYLVSGSYICGYMTMVVSMNEKNLVYDRLEVCLAFRCLKYRLGADGSLHNPKVVPFDRMYRRRYVSSYYVNFPTKDARPRIFDVDELGPPPDSDPATMRSVDT